MRVRLKTRIATAIGLMAAALTGGPAFAGSPSHPTEGHNAAELAAVKAAAAEIAAGWKAKDVARVMAQFADDASIMETGTVAQHGKAAAQAAAEQFVQDPNFQMDIAPEKYVVTRARDLAYVRGRYTMQYSATASTTATVTGSFIAIFRKEPDGLWKVVEDISASEP